MIPRLSRLLAAGWLCCAMASHAMAADPEPDATIFGEPVYLDRLQPPEGFAEAMKRMDRDPAEALAVWRLEAAQRRIWQALTDRFCAEADCEPTEEDHAAFKAGVKRATGNRPPPSQPMIPDEEYRRVKAELMEMLVTAPNEDERKAAENALIKLEQVRNWQPGDVSREVSGAMVKAWKFNRALYAKYGGKVIWQQLGLEPVGAYEAWLKEHQAGGSFTIRNPELAQQFWRYFSIEHQEVDDEFLASAGLTHPFEKPWWLMDAKPPAPADAAAPAPTP